MDYIECGQKLANLLFVQPNATAVVRSTDLVVFAQILDTQMPLGTIDPTPFIVGITTLLTGDLPLLNQAQIINAATWFLPYREPPAVVPTEE